MSRPENMHATHYTSSGVTTLLTSLVFFSCSFKVDKVKGLISRVCAVIKKQQCRDNGVKTSKDRRILCLFCLPFIAAAIAFCPCGSTGKLSLCLLLFSMCTVDEMEDAPSLVVQVSVKELFHLNKVGGW